MKRVAFGIGLLSLASLSLSMQPELHEPSQRTRKYVEAALNAFEIPLNSIKIYGFHDEHSKTGWANSDTKVIAINENLTDLFKEWICFHEVGHLKDDYSKKIKTYPKYETGLFASICTGVYLFLNQTPGIKNSFNSRPFKILAHSAYSLLASCSAYLFYKKIALPYEQEQGEIRADKIAIERLIELNNVNPILYYLLVNKKLAHDNIRSNQHPPAAQEYKATKKILINHGFKVTKSYPQDIPYQLKIEISKENYQASIQAGNFYTKV